MRTITAVALGTAGTVVTGVAGLGAFLLAPAFLPERDVVRTEAEPSREDIIRGLRRMADDLEAGREATIQLLKYGETDVAREAGRYDTRVALWQQFVDEDAEHDPHAGCTMPHQGSDGLVDCDGRPL
jgi:hypothetical protein